MNDLQKLLVVDDGDRTLENSLSSDLAELGFSSVTTSLEAADDVLQLIARPAAIFLQMPASLNADRHAAFVDLSDRLRKSSTTADIPVFMVDGMIADMAGGLPSILRRPLGSEVLDASSPLLN